jgi:hypothetical protein
MKVPLCCGHSCRKRRPGVIIVHQKRLANASINPNKAGLVDRPTSCQLDIAHFPFCLYNILSSPATSLTLRRLVVGWKLFREVARLGMLLMSLLGSVRLLLGCVLSLVICGIRALVSVLIGIKLAWVMAVRSGKLRRWRCLRWLGYLIAISVALGHGQLMSKGNVQGQVDLLEPAAARVLMLLTTHQRATWAIWDHARTGVLAHVGLMRTADRGLRMTPVTWAGSSVVCIALSRARGYS